MVVRVTMVKRSGWWNYPVTWMICLDCQAKWTVSTSVRANRDGSLSDVTEVCPRCQGVLWVASVNLRTGEWQPYLPF